MSQNERLLRYLQTHVGITPDKAYSELGIYRLSGRIFDLRRDGNKIQTIKTPFIDRLGNKGFIAEYRLEK